MHGDSVMADKGFDIKDLLFKYGVRLNIPPFKKGETQMTPEDLMTTKKIAGVRMLREKMQQIKCFKILAGEIDNTLFDVLEQLVFVCAMLASFEGNTICCNMLKYYLVVMQTLGYLQLFLHKDTQCNRKQVQICTICTRNSYK